MRIQSRRRPPPSSSQLKIRWQKRRGSASLRESENANDQLVRTMGEQLLGWVASRGSRAPARRVAAAVRQLVGGAGLSRRSLLLMVTTICMAATAMAMAMAVTVMAPKVVEGL